MENKISDIVLNKVRLSVANLPVPMMIGFSGGADSTVLVDTLSKILGNANIICLHVNHMLRGNDANLDEEHCRQFCKNRNINFLCAKVDVKNVSKGVAVEEVARNIRYQVFSDACIKNNCKFIALAHTKSDNSETIIFNLARGSGSNGLKGIPKTRPINAQCFLVRPLLNVSREEIEEYCKENNLDYVTDKTNFDTVYSRNFIRAEIVPRFKKLNPAFDDALQTMSKNIGFDSDYLDNVTAGFVKDNMTQSGINLEKLNALHYAIASRVIRTYAWHNLEDKHISQILYLAKEGKDGSVICLPFGMKACCEDGNLVIYQKDKMPKKIERFIYNYMMPKSNMVFLEGFAISLNTPNPPNNHHLCGYMKCKKSDLDNMQIRSYTASDKYFFHNMTRNIKKTAQTLDKNIQMVRPVFVYNGNVIWYPGYPVSPEFNQDKCDTMIFYFEKNQVLEEKHE